MTVIPMVKHIVIWTIDEWQKAADVDAESRRAVRELIREWYDQPDRDELGRHVYVRSPLDPEDILLLRVPVDGEDDPELVEAWLEEIDDMARRVCRCPQCPGVPFSLAHVVEHAETALAEGYRGGNPVH